MRRFVLSIFVIIVSLSAAIAQDKVNQLDEAGKRHGIWKKFYPNTKQLRYEGQFEHGKEIGVFKFYCKECGNKPTSVKTFSNDSDISEVSYFTIKGKLVSQGKMRGKDRIGEWVYFQKKSDQPMSKETYVNGKLDGMQIIYYPNGNITEEITYVGGVKQGNNNYYSPDGVLLKKLIYHNNKLHGPAAYYDVNGNVTIKGFYKDGKKHGLWQYFQDGKIAVEETYPKPLHNN